MFRKTLGKLELYYIRMLAVAVQAGRGTRAACQVTTPQSSMHSVLTGISIWTLTCITGISPVRQPGGFSSQADSSPGQALQLVISNGRGRHLMEECGRQRYRSMLEAECHSTCPATRLRTSLSSCLSPWRPQHSPCMPGCMSLMRASQTLWESLSRLGHMMARQRLDMSLHGPPVRGKKPYGAYPVQQHQDVRAYPSAPRPMQRGATHDSCVSGPGRCHERVQRSSAAGHAQSLGRHPYAYDQDQAPPWQQLGTSAHPAYEMGRRLPEAHSDDPRFMGRRQHASMQAMHAGGVPRSAGGAGPEAVSKYPAGELSCLPHSCQQGCPSRLQLAVSANVITDNQACNMP